MKKQSMAGIYIACAAGCLITVSGIGVMTHQTADRMLAQAEKKPDAKQEQSTQVATPNEAKSEVHSAKTEGPGAQTVCTEPRAERVYVIQWGDTLAELAARFGCSVQELAKYNGISNVDLIYAGNLLRIPG